ncbi:MAG: S1/P1 nuclease [Sphingomonadaceae bacterium]|uniref:S1/P1 nuclease n=1 Tax=Thermaurantiacus sp. TaxID=2820283 RepID=UPI00298F2BA7|nr:S1/P1 nuclease [Thermaurantiacus sp.]MCS6986074.1 S1/P1 nuclease [Sphingomonadaceae bacterium]MDW8414710.1 S1/P1 nuclease [Thermaurantiacus sp.]
MRRALAWLVAAALWPSPAAAWGPTGHRITAALADRFLSPRARAAVLEILGNERLEEASTWADFMRSAPDPFWRVTASPWHYVTVPDGRRWRDQPAPPQGDAVTALARFAATLRDPGASLADRQLALRFAVHVIADLAQPLHVGRPGDRGGNDVKVRFFGRETNLHAVWDDGLIDHERLSCAEWADRLARRLTPEELRAWSDPDPEQWVDDAVALRAAVYPASSDLAWDYVFAQRRRLDEQLAKGGLRIAAWLNRLFDAR